MTQANVTLPVLALAFSFGVIASFALIGVALYWFMMAPVMVHSVCAEQREGAYKRRADPRAHVSRRQEQNGVTAYNTAAGVHDLSSESAIWLSMISERIFLDLRSSGAFRRRALGALYNLIDTTKLPSALGHVIVRELDFGSSLPQVRNAKVVSGSLANIGSVETVVVVDIDYVGCIAATVDTELVINWPVVSLAALPVSFSLCLSCFFARVRLRVPAYEGAGSASPFYLSFEEQPTFEVKLKSELGSRKKLRDLQKLEDLLTHHLSVALAGFVSPKEVPVSLQKLLKKESPIEEQLGRPLADHGSNGLAPQREIRVHEHQE